MTIKISQLANLTVVQANTIVPVVSNITGTLTTVKGNVEQLQTYVLETAGNIIPRASNVYSIGNSTTWWKDLWLSANTLYIGGVPIGTSGGQLTFGGNAVGTSGLDTYTGNVSASNISAGSTAIGNITTAPTFNVEGASGNITAGNIASVGNLSTASVSTPTVTTDVVSVGSSVDFITGAVPYDGATMISAGTGYGWGQLYYPSGGTGTGLAIMVQGVSYPSGAITGYTVYLGGEGYTVGDTLTIADAGSGTAQFTIDTVTSTGTMTSGASTWTFDPAGDTTFPGGTVIDDAGNILLSDSGGNTTVTIDSIEGNISAGNISVYGVESDTLSLTLSNSTSDVLPSSDGGVILSTGTVATNVNTQYWGFNPTGVTWFTVVDDTNIQAGMQIYWAGHIIGTVTSVGNANVSCTALTNVTPNFLNGSLVSFGDPAPLYTDEVTTNSGNLTITGNVSIEGNVINTENVTVGGNVTVLSWLKGPPTANLNISSDSGQPIRLLANAGAKTWTFNSNGSVTFPDNTLQSTAGTYGNVQVTTYLPNYSGNIGRIIVNDGLAVVGNIQVGYALPNATFANVIVSGIGSANGYSQLNIQNVDSVGTQNSADFIATAPDGTDTSKYIDMGINGNNYSSSSWTVSGANDGYVYINSGNLTLGTDTQGTTVKVHVGGTLAGNVVTTFANTGATVAGNLTVSGSCHLANVRVPTLANSAGTAGQITWDSNYVYVCIATNTWKRANISTW